MATIDDILNKKKPDVAPGLNPKDMKPLPSTPSPKTEPTAPKTETTPMVEEHKENTMPQKPQPSGEPIDESKFKPFGFYDNFRPEDYGETKEEREAREKREKREAVLATLADGFAAFHNAYFHARGAQPMQGIGGNASKLQQRLYKEKHDRENRGLKIYDMQQRAKQFEANENWRKDQADLANKREERLNKKLELDKEKNDSYRKYQESLANKNNEQAAYWKAKWQALEDGKDLDVALKEAKVATERARAGQASSVANLNKVRAENVGNGVGEYTTETEVHRDQFGNITGRTTRRTKGANGSGTSTPASPAKPANNGKKRNPMDSANETPKNNGKKKNPMN